MEWNFSAPSPKPKNLAIAQEIIDALWKMIGSLDDQAQNQQSLIEKQSVLIKKKEVRIKHLEERLKTNSSNSSKPPSSDPNRKKKCSSRSGNRGRKAGGQRGHKGVARTLLPEEEVDEIVKCMPPSICGCSGKIEVCEDYRRHQTHDIPEIKAKVTEYQQHDGVCTCCGKKHEAVLPEGVSRSILSARSFGVIGTLTGGYRMSKRMVKRLLKDLFNLDVSVGTISHCESTVSESLIEPVEEAKEFIQQAYQVNCDETGHKTKGKKRWVWVAIAGMVSVFAAGVSRSKEVAKDLLGEGFSGFLNSDRYNAYSWVEMSLRQVCWAHLKREFKKISERSGLAGKIGDELLALIKQMFTNWDKLKNSTISRVEFQSRMKPIRQNILSALHRAETCGEEKTQKTCKNILKYEEALWTFVEHKGVEPTNNLAEQVIRFYVVWRKSSFGTQSERGNRFIERIMTVGSSCRLQNRNMLEFVTQSVEAHFGKGVRPSLVPT